MQNWQYPEISVNDSTTNTKKNIVRNDFFVSLSFPDTMMLGTGSVRVKIRASVRVSVRPRVRVTGMVRVAEGRYH